MQALIAAGVAMSSTAPAVQPASFEAQPLDESMIATALDIRALIDEPRDDVTVIDTRSEQEYIEDGSIPGAVLLDYVGNNFADGTFRPVTHQRIRYIEAGVDLDEGAILFCKTSIRGAQSFLAMYNAGYRNLRLYDGAWVDWVANPMNPIYRAEPELVQLRASDNS
jgi:thiosulfate/3-mercaptopyruvate sulfurtransferase